MIGVVLWSDRSKNRAVIWCEDHGDLAFYSTDSYDAPELHEGDCVSFDVVINGDLRHVEDLCIVEEETHVSLATCLTHMGRADPVSHQTRPEPCKMARKGGVQNYPAEVVAKRSNTAELIPFPGGGSQIRKNTARRAKACRVIQVS